MQSQWAVAELLGTHVQSQWVVAELLATHVNIGEDDDEPVQRVKGKGDWMDKTEL